MLLAGELVNDRQQDVPRLLRAAQFVERVGEVDETERAVRYDHAQRLGDFRRGSLRLRQKAQIGLSCPECVGVVGPVFVCGGDDLPQLDENFRRLFKEEQAYHAQKLQNLSFMK